MKWRAEVKPFVNTTPFFVLLGVLNPCFCFAISTLKVVLRVPTTGMATKETGEENQHPENSQAGGFIGAVEAKYREIKEHAETYPYVWASYAVVYGGLALWSTYRWRKLRKTEDRVRALQERLRKHYEAEERASATISSSTSRKPATPVQKVPTPSADKTLK
ncbi:hypothetical protein ACLB2K_058275 [Fragaria x ananassa]